MHEKLLNVLSDEYTQTVSLISPDDDVSSNDYEYHINTLFDSSIELCYFNIE